MDFKSLGQITILKHTINELELVHSNLQDQLDKSEQKYGILDTYLKALFGKIHGIVRKATTYIFIQIPRKKRFHYNNLKINQILIKNTEIKFKEDSHLSVKYEYFDIDKKSDRRYLTVPILLLIVEGVIKYMKDKMLPELKELQHNRTMLLAVMSNNGLYCHLCGQLECNHDRL